MVSAMEKDFYLNERALAGYLEKDWFDHIQRSDARKPAFAFAPFDSTALYSDHHERLVEFLVSSLHKAQVKPRGLLEVGASLGRTFYEVCKQIKSIESATLVEPSQNLFSLFAKIFEGDDLVKLSILKGNLELEEVALNTRPIKAACSLVKVLRLNSPFQKLNQDLGKFDLVICANVIDQCRDHLQLVDFLKKSVAPGGVLLLSCTYQWNDKYIGNAPEPIKDINGLFNSQWSFLNETNLPFQIRVNERYWMTFLSHVVAYRLGA
jgi:SAM-dependent methyltransferase